MTDRHSAFSISFRNRFVEMPVADDIKAEDFSPLHPICKPHNSPKISIAKPTIFLCLEIRIFPITFALDTRVNSTFRTIL